MAHSKNTLYIIIFTFLLISLFTPIHTKAATTGQDSIILTESTEKIKLDNDMDILVDENREYTFKQVVTGSLDQQFHKYSGVGRPNMGYTTAAYWVRVTVDNQSLNSNWLLEIDSPKINRVALYMPRESGDFKKVITGNAIPFKERDIPHRNLIYNLSLTADEPQTFYLRVTTGSSMQLPLTLWEPFAFDKETNVEYMMFGILIGVSLVMALYNFFLYFSIRSRSYLYYSLFVVVNALLYISDMGLGYQFLWPNLVEWNLRAVVTFMCLDSIGALLFARSFFEIKKSMPKLDVFYKVLMMLTLLPPLWIIFSYRWAVEAAIISVAATVIIVIFTVTISLRRHYRPARFFALAWGFFLFGVSVSVLVDAGLLPLTLFTKYAWQFTTGIEIILLSFALGDRIKVIREEKEEAEKAAKASHQLAIKNLHKSDKLKDEFLAVTSHELRTPLHGIIGIAETMKEGAAGELTNEVQSHLSMIIRSGRRLANLVDDILDFSELKNNELDIQFDAVHLKGLADVVLTVCQPLAEVKDLQLVNEIEEDIPRVRADKSRLQQILYNLVGNAIKYTKSGRVTVSAEQTDDLVEIKVSDTGKGIAPDQLDAIFEPFYQENGPFVRDVGGTGIGLNITKKLVDLHQGDIYVHSELDKGSVFGFTLLISKMESPSDQKTDSEKLHAATREIDASFVVGTNDSSNEKETTILIADDESVNLQVLQNQLMIEGYGVIAVSQGEEVLEQVKKHNVDLLILDVMMPKVSGYDICRRIRTEFTLTELPILMLTARNRMEDMVASFNAGANDHLAKPCDKQELLQRVKTLIQLGWITKEHIKLNQRLEGKVEERTQALRSLNDELEKVNNDLVYMNEVRSELLANIAHELGTPVTMIHSYVQAVEQGLIQANQARYLDMVYSKINVLNRLTHDLSDLSRLEAGQITLKLERFPLDTWIEKLLNKVEFDVNQGNRKYLLPEAKHIHLFQDFFIYIDVNRMDQVFSNLVRNAIKYTSPDGGEISITLNLKEDNLLIIGICDNGTGIDKERLPQVFDRYFKTSASSSNSESDGTGLGLAIVKEIIKLHQAKVWAESQVDKGSSFYISLPIHPKRG